MSIQDSIHESEPIFRMDNVRKHFGGTIALQGVSFALRPGEVHALIGENGAGKSTLMRILGGEIRADEGAMHFRGREWSPSGPSEARKAGVAMIHQELALAPHLSVAQNIALGCEPGGGSVFGRVRRLRTREMALKATDALAMLGHAEIDPLGRTGDLGPAQKQIVEIARALAGRASVIVMDEPTTSLGQEDAQRLLDVIGTLRAQGTSIVYISHFLEEIVEIADRWTVLRDGMSVGTGMIEGTTTPELIECMIGRPLEEVFPDRNRIPGTLRLRAEHVSGTRLPRDASLEVRAGEILGLAGLVGAGRTELLRVLAGLDPLRSGRLWLDGETSQATGFRARMRAGLGLLSEDRKGEGLALRMPVATNLLLSKLSTATRCGVLSSSRMTEHSAHWIKRLKIKARGCWGEVGTLSGGNQQKVAIGRLLNQEAGILLLDEPTRGIDVGSKVQVYALLDELARSGCAIVVSSGHATELLGLCDSIAVMHRGVLCPTRPAKECTEKSIMTEAVFGLQHEEDVA